VGVGVGWGVGGGGGGGCKGVGGEVPDCDFCRSNGGANFYFRGKGTEPRLRRGSSFGKKRKRINTSANFIEKGDRFKMLSGNFSGIGGGGG